MKLSSRWIAGFAAVLTVGIAVSGARLAQSATLVSARDPIVGSASRGVSGNGWSFLDGISADGRAVLFTSEASDLVPDDRNEGRDVFVRDVATGVTDLVSVDRTGKRSGNSWSWMPRMSADGRYVAFVSSASDLVPNDVNGAMDIFVRDRVKGLTKLVTVDRSGTHSGFGHRDMFPPNYSMSPNGRFIAFNGEGTGYTDDPIECPDPNSLDCMNVYLRDLVAETTELISMEQTGQRGGNGPSYLPTLPINGGLSDDGRFIVFSSAATDLVSGDTNGHWDVFVRDRQTGRTTLVSVDRAGTKPANGESAMYDLVISPDGRYVLFASEATDLIAGVAPGKRAHYYRDLEAEVTRLTSPQAFFESVGGDPAISADGRFLVHTVPPLYMGRSDVLMRDRVFDTETLVNTDGSGVGRGNGDSYGPKISANGSTIAFMSDASDLVPGDENEQTDVFVALVRPERAGKVAGDLNASGGPDVADAVLLLRVLSGLRIPTLLQRELGDMNGDGRIGTADLTVLLRKVVEFGSGSTP